jgi:hypothetical protein
VIVLWAGRALKNGARGLQLIVNNLRFLILPWVRCASLASRVLARCARQLPQDCAARCGYAPVLIESFVERERGRGSVRAGGFPVGFATTHEPNGNAAISTSCSDCNSRQTDWTRSLVFQTQPGRTSCLWLAAPKLATSQIAAVHLWVQAFWSKRPGSPGSGGASPYRAGASVRFALHILSHLAITAT